MFKAPAPALRRSLSLYSRAARSAARHGSSSFDVVAVRFTRPPLSRSRLAGALTISAATFALGHSLGFFDEPTAAHDDSPHDSEWTTVTDDQSSTRILFFLPTGFARPQKRVLYGQDDPEVLETDELTADRARLNKIRDALARTLRTWLTTQPRFVRHFGQIDPTKGGVDFSVIVPSGPPLEYDQPGLALTEDLELCTATRVFDHSQYQHLSALLYPRAVIKATWIELRATTARTWDHVTLFMAGNHPIKPEPIQEMLQPLSAKPLFPTATTASPDRPPTSLTAEHSQSQSLSSLDLADAVGKAHLKMDIQLPDFREFSKLSKIIRDILDFGASIEIPRGCIVVQGQAQVVGSRNSGFVLVKFCYHLKENRIVMFKIYPKVKTGHRWSVPG